MTDTRKAVQDEENDDAPINAAPSPANSFNPAGLRTPRIDNPLFEYVVPTDVRHYFWVDTMLMSKLVNIFHCGQLLLN